MVTLTAQSSVALKSLLQSPTVYTVDPYLLPSIPMTGTVAQDFWHFTILDSTFHWQRQYILTTLWEQQHQTYTPTSLLLQYSHVAPADQIPKTVRCLCACRCMFASKECWSKKTFVDIGKNNGPWIPIQAVNFIPHPKASRNIIYVFPHPLTNKKKFGKYIPYFVVLIFFLYVKQMYTIFVEACWLTI